MKKQIPIERRKELEKMFDNNYTSCAIEGLKLSPAEKLKFKNLYLADMTSDEMVEILKKNMKLK